LEFTASSCSNQRAALREVRLASRLGGREAEKVLIARFDVYGLQAGALAGQPDPQPNGGEPI
jgi:hypothetical protein